MFPVFVYTAVAAAAVVAAQAFRPSDALRDEHHRKLYWTGAAASIGLISVFGAVLVA
jgi:hypothetical protein